MNSDLLIYSFLIFKLSLGFGVNFEFGLILTFGLGLGERFLILT